jgi:hypothetical protein
MPRRYPKKVKNKKPERVAEVAPDAADAIDTVVFRSGNSDAVRLPKRFGLVGKTVRIRREGDSRIVIELKAKRGWPPGFFDQFKGDFGLRRPPGPPVDPDPRMERLIRRMNGEEE